MRRHEARAPVLAPRFQRDLARNYLRLPPAFTSTGRRAPCSSGSTRRAKSPSARHRELELAAALRRQAQVAQDVRAAYAAADTALRQVVFIRDELLPEAREAYRIASTSYGLGGSRRSRCWTPADPARRREPIHGRTRGSQRRAGRPRARRRSAPLEAPLEATMSPNQMHTAVLGAAATLLPLAAAPEAPRRRRPRRPGRGNLTLPADATREDPACQIEPIAVSPHDRRRPERWRSTATRSTQVLAPHLRPRVPDPGRRREPVSAGEPLASVASPDFAAAVCALPQGRGAPRATLRRIADLDEQLFKNDALARRDIEQAQTDAVGRGRPRCGARQLRSLGVDDEDARRPPRGPADPRRRGRDPLADRRHGRRAADQPGPAAAGGDHAVLHRRRPLDGVGDGQRVRARPAVRRARATRRTSRPTSRPSRSPARSTTSPRSWIRHQGHRGPHRRAEPARRAQEGHVRAGRDPFARARRTGCSFRSRRCCATTRTCPSSSSPTPTATFARRRGDSSAPASATGTRSSPGCTPANRSSVDGGALPAVRGEPVSRAGRRRPDRDAPRTRVVHQPHRRARRCASAFLVLLSAALLVGARALVVLAPARRRLSRSLAADGRDHRRSGPATPPRRSSG